MNRITMMTRWLIIFCFLVIGATSYAAEPASQAVYQTYEVRGMLGTNVKDIQGGTLGIVHDIVIDSHGRAAFVILSYGLKGIKEKLVAVPFDALSFDRAEKDLVLNTSREKLESAPAFDERDLINLKKVEDIYKYFGQQPYWNEGETSSSGQLPMKEEKPRGSTSDFDEMG